MALMEIPAFLSHLRWSMQKSFCTKRTAATQREGRHA